MAESPVTKIRLLEGFRFKAEFDNDIPSVIVDELKPIGKGSGPNPTRLLSVAIGQCLSSSLLYCLQKARVKVNGLQATVKANVERNDAGYLRITAIAVKIQPDVAEEDKEKLPRCLKVFENYCTLTQSVIQGIKVNVDITET